MMRRDITDETLMAYADGELAPDERQRVADALENDADLRARLQIFEQTGRELGHLFDQPLNEPVPPHLIEIVRGAETRQDSAHDPGPLESLVKRLRDTIADLSSPAAGWATAGVAATVFALGLSVGLWFQNSPGQQAGARLALLKIEDNHIWAQGALRTALEDAASGESRTWPAAGKSGTVVPVLTFKDKTGRFCREYSVSGTPAASAVGIACRDSADRWSIEIHTAQTPEATAITPAAGAGIERLNALMTEMSKGDPLDLDQEETVIRNGWQ